MDLEQEGLRLTELLKELKVESCYRHKANEVVVVFSDGTRLFMDSSDSIEISITGADE